MKRFRHKLRSVLRRHPLAAAISGAVLCGLPTWLLAGWSGLSREAGLAHHAALGLLAALLLTALGWWSEAGFLAPSHWRNLHLAAVPLVAVFLCFPGVGAVEGAWFAPYALLALLMAFQREAWFRGLLFRTLVPAYGPRRTVELTALLYGLPQVLDILAGAAPGVTLVKALVCALFGYVLGALRLRTRSIWPGVVIGTVFYLTLFLDRLRASEEVLPQSSDRLMLQVLLTLVVYACARLWMRRASEQPVFEGESVRAS